MGKFLLTLLALIPLCFGALSCAEALYANSEGENLYYSALQDSSNSAKALYAPRLETSTSFGSAIQYIGSPPIPPKPASSGGGCLLSY